MKLRIKLSSVDVRLLDSAVKTVISAVEARASSVIAIPLPTRDGVSKRIVEIRDATSEVVDALTKLYITQAVHIVIL